MRKIMAAAIFVVILSFVVGIYAYPYLPEKFSSHWNAQGRANGYMPKMVGIFLIPVISILLLALFYTIPKIDPKKASIDKFRKYYDGFILIFASFFLYLQILIILWNAGFSFNFIQLLIPAFAALFYYCGVLMEKANRNWFVGIRTPWTLSSDKVWKKTHERGSKIFKAAAVISLLGIVVSDYAIFLMIIPVIFAAIYSYVYSYVLWKRKN